MDFLRKTITLEETIVEVSTRSPPPASGGWSSPDVSDAEPTDEQDVRSQPGRSRCTA
jgi:hypothetical protein